MHFTDCLLVLIRFLFCMITVRTIHVIRRLKYTASDSLGSVISEAEFESPPGLGVGAPAECLSN